jgi:hypothetical protein
MKKTKEPLRRIYINVPIALSERIKAYAERHNLTRNELLILWLEANVATGADVVLGKSH